MQCADLVPNRPAADTCSKPIATGAQRQDEKVITKVLLFPARIQHDARHLAQQLMISDLRQRRPGLHGPIHKPAYRPSGP